MAEMSCPHFATLSREKFTYEYSATFASIRDNTRRECSICKRRAKHLWLCLHSQCLLVLCSDDPANHVLYHYKDSSHCVLMNLNNLRLWCYECEAEIIIGSQEEEDDEPHTMVVEPHRPKGLTGLQNLGNTCYMNSALQALCNTPPLVHYFLEKRYDDRPVTVQRYNSPGDLNTTTRNQCLTSALHNLVLEMWSGLGQEYLVPAPILYAISHTHPMFRGFQQHDSQEFLRCLMDQLHEEMKVPGLEPLSNAFGPEESSDNDLDASSEGEEYETCDSGVSERSSLSEDTSQLKPITLSVSRSPSPSEHRKVKSQGQGTPSKNKKVHYTSIISDIFDGTLLSSVQCLTCNRISTRVETFQDLSLPIPNRDHLNILHQGNVSGPPKCTHLYTIEQSWFAWFWDWVCSLFWGPTVSLHDCLSAFFSADELKGDNMYSCEKCNKLRNGVKYSRVLKMPEVLCIHLKRFRHDLMFSSKISSYISFPMEGLDMKTYMHRDCSCTVTRYELMSVICHHGSSGSGGHYTCYALNTSTNQWYHYDDHSVTKVSQQAVKNSQAYVLFYRKESTRMCRLRKRISAIQELSQNEPKRYLVSAEWMSRFNSLSEPGPIDNRKLLYGSQDCNGSQSLRASVSLSGPVWSYLQKTFGGGPQITTDMSFNLIDCHYNSRRDQWNGECGGAEQQWDEKSNSHSQGEDSSSLFCTGGLNDNNSDGDSRSVEVSCDNQDSGIWMDQKSKEVQSNKNIPV